MLQKVYAQVATTIQDPLSTRFGVNATLAGVFGLIINIVIGVGIALTIVYLVLGGIQYITAKGDAKAADAARSALTNAIIGFGIVVGAVTLKIVFGNLLGTEEDQFSQITPL